MRIHRVLALIGAATLSLSAFADPPIVPSPSAANGTQDQAGPSARHRLSKDDADHMRGTFLLTDGRTIRLTSENRKLFVDLDGKREEMVPVGPTQFVTRDSGARIAFNRVPYADEVVVDQAAR